MRRRHIEGRMACPHLPPVERVWTAGDMAEFRRSPGGGSYLAALSFAQSLWLEGKPAQALLQLNKALMVELGGSADRPVSRESGCGPLDWPLPYAAKLWVMQGAVAGEFLGNPVRHYQHLATRMSGPRAELRTWRAWACFHLAERALTGGSFPRDERQIAREGIELPGWDEVTARLARLGLPGEDALLGSVAETAAP